MARMFGMVVLLGMIVIMIAVVKSAAQTLPPLLFLPGYGGNRLTATLSPSVLLPASCDGLSLPYGVPIELLYNATMLVKAPQCVYDLLRLDFDQASQSYTPTVSGVSIEVPNFGHFESLESVYWSFARNAEELWGYKRNENLFAIPFDYRFMSESSLSRAGFLTQFKTFIEKVYYHNQRQRVLILGHSNGGPTIYTFLQSTVLSPQWKAQYIAGIVTLSGNLLGQMNAIMPFVYQNNPMKQSTVCSWEATYGSLPFGGYAPVSAIEIVTTNDGAKRYTSQLTDLVSLMDSIDVNHEWTWSARMSAMYSSMNRTAHPLVDVYCLYGSNVTTSYAFEFTGAAGTDEIYSSVLEMDGDGNQDIIDNSFCNVWAADPKGSSFHFESQAFPGVEHMRMYSDSAVLQKIGEIIRKYTRL